MEKNKLSYKYELAIIIVGMIAVTLMWIEYSNLQDDKQVLLDEAFAQEERALFVIDKYTQERMFGKSRVTDYIVELDYKDKARIVSIGQDNYNDIKVGSLIRVKATDEAIIVYGEEKDSYFIDSYFID